MRIVIIEDNERYANVIQNALDGFATEIVTVSTWKEAEPYLHTKPDVAWVDLQLPDSEARDTIVKIAEVRSKNAEIVIIVVSGFVDDEIRKAALESGVDVIENKNAASTRRKLISLILLAMNGAQNRMPTERRVSLLEHAARFISSTFPQQQTT